MTIAEMRLPHKMDKRHIALPSKCAVLLFAQNYTISKSICLNILLADKTLILTLSPIL